MKVAPTPNQEDSLCYDLPKLFTRDGSVALPVAWNLKNLSTSYSEAQHLGGELRAEASGEKIVVSGELCLTWSGPCRRCLETTNGDNDLIISEIYERDSTEGETFELPMDQILDLRPMLQEQILLALPLTPLCSEDCQGPIPEEYPARSKSQQEGNHNLDPPIDPRWEALGSLTFEEEEIN